MLIIWTEGVGLDYATICDAGVKASRWRPPPPSCCNYIKSIEMKECVDLPAFSRTHFLSAVLRQQRRNSGA